MGVAVQLFPFDSIKYYQKIVPELRKGSKSTFLRDEFLAYTKSYPYFGGNMAKINILENFDKGFDVEFKYHLDSVKIQNKFSLSWFDETVRFFEYLIGHQCLDLSFFYSIGRYDPIYYFDKTIKNTISSNVLNMLSDRNLFWTHSGGGWNEGIRGWITNEDVELLILDLPSLKINDDLTTKEFDEFIKFLKILKLSNKGILCGADLILDIPPYNNNSPYGLQSYQDNKHE